MTATPIDVEALASEVASSVFLMVHTLRTEAPDDVAFVSGAEALVNNAGDCLIEAIREAMIEDGYLSVDIIQIQDRALAAFFDHIDKLITAAPPRLTGNA